MIRFNVVDSSNAIDFNVQSNAVTFQAEQGKLIVARDYDALRNRPSIAGVVLTGDKSLADLGIADESKIPTKTSDLTNDSGFLTTHQSLDGYATESWVQGQGYIKSAPVSSVNGETGAVELTGSDIDVSDSLPMKIGVAFAVAEQRLSVVEEDVELKQARIDNEGILKGNGNGSISAAVAGTDYAIPSQIPTKTSDLTNDSGFITSAPVSSVNGQTGAVVLVIPTKTSDLTNDSGFLTQHQSLAGYATESWVQGQGYLKTAPVTSVNGQTGAVTVTVPTKVSDLTNDSAFLTLADLPIYDGTVV